MTPNLLFIQISVFSLAVQSDKIIQSKTTGISKRTSNKELQALQEVWNTLTRDSRTKPQNFENLGPIRTGRSPNLAVRVSLTLTLLLIFLIKNFIFVKYWWFFKLRLFSGRKFLQHHLSKVLFATIFYWQWLDSDFFPSITRRVIEKFSNFEKVIRQWNFEP